MMRILLIEDEKITRITLTNTLKKEGYDVISCETGVEGLEQFRKGKYDVVITDLRLPKMNGLDILREVKKQSPNTFMIVITAFASVETAVEALKLGAYDYLTKPFSPDQLLSMLDHIRQFHKVQTENIKLRKRLDVFENKVIVTNSDSMKKLIETIKVIAQNDYTVLIEGESGTGKEMIARSLHFNSPRVNHSFIPINCSVIPETLLESELFGHEKGAFTGAHNKHIGLFERADKGTIFIDDIDDFPLPLQVKLLRVLQERELTRVGGTQTIQVNVRIIVATKVDLNKLVEQNKFRDDLYYRLNIIPINIPPLRERKNDIPLLVDHFFHKHNAKNKLSLLTKTIIKYLTDYHWPGNVRELENFVERMIALSEVGDWDEEIFNPLKKESPTAIEHENIEQKSYPSYQKFIIEKEKEIFEWAMKKADNNVSLAAEMLGLPRSTFRSKLEKFYK
ncbi:MAG: sigma-54 dependent transcriptional regulator [Bacteroidota bacterium]